MNDRRSARGHDTLLTPAVIVLIVQGGSCDRHRATEPREASASVSSLRGCRTDTSAGHGMGHTSAGELLEVSLYWEYPS